MRASELNLKNEVIVYVDMDGVLVDLYNDIANILKVNHYNNISPDQWEDFYKNVDAYKLFRDATSFSSSNKLLQMIKDFVGNVNILSTPLVYHQEECIKGKKEWLKKNISVPLNSVIFEKEKQKYATINGHSNILIDDSDSVLSKWTDAGGISIKFRGDDDTVEDVFNKLKSIIYPQEKNTGNSFSEGKNRKKKKVKIPAYGPGPLGMYGTAGGYSGAGGVGEGSDKDDEAPYHVRILDRQTKKVLADEEIGDWENAAVDRAEAYLSWAKTKGMDIVAQVYQPAYGKNYVTWQVPDEGNYDLKEQGVEEGWRDTLAGLALGTGLAMGSPVNAKNNVEKIEVQRGQTVYSIARAFGTTPEVVQQLNKLDKNFTIQPGQVIKVPKIEPIITNKNTTPSKQPVAKKDQKKIDTSKTLTGTRHEAILTAEARRSGINNPVELAAFLAQMSHETNNFKSLVEYGGSLDFKKYDIRFNPRKAKELGNIKPGDGARYKGRGYIQLTGRYNYKRAGEALGLPLEQKPELVEQPDIAARVAVWFWKQRVQPRVDNFNDVRSVTKPINPGLAGLENRKIAFQDFKAFKQSKGRI